MTITDLTVDVTLNNLTLLLISGTLAGMITGQLMKSRGLSIVGDFCFSLLGMFLGVVVLGTLLEIGHVGYVGYLVLAIMGAIVTVVLAHVALLVRRKVTAS